MLELFTTAASGAAGLAAPYAKAAGDRIWGADEDSGAASKKDQHRCPLLCFLEFAVLTLDDPAKLHGMKIDVHKTTIDRCPAGPGAGIARRIRGQSRDNLTALVDDAVRAARLYDPNEKSEFGKSVNFLFRQTIKGLTVIESTYANGKDSKSDIAIKSIVMTQKILQLTLTGTEGEGLVEESSIESRSSGDYHRDFHTKITLADLEDMKKKQQLEEEETQKAGLWTTDSKSFWITSEDDGEDVDQLTPIVNILRNLTIMHKRIFKERKHAQYDTKFTQTKELYELILKIIKANYWNKMH